MFDVTERLESISHLWDRLRVLYSSLQQRRRGSSIIPLLRDIIDTLLHLYSLEQISVQALTDIVLRCRVRGIAIGDDPTTAVTVDDLD